MADILQNAFPNALYQAVKLAWLFLCDLGRRFYHYNPSPWLTTIEARPRLIEATPSTTERSADWCECRVRENGIFQLEYHPDSSDQKATLS